MKFIELCGWAMYLQIIGEQFSTIIKNQLYENLNLSLNTRTVSELRVAAKEALSQAYEPWPEQRVR